MEVTREVIKPITQFSKAVTMAPNLVVMFDKFFSIASVILGCKLL